MGQDIHPPVFAGCNIGNNLLPVPPDQPAGLHVLVRHLPGLRISRGNPLRGQKFFQRLLHLVQRPSQVDGCGPGRGQRFASLVQRIIGGIGFQREANAIGRGYADQRRAPHLHGLDRLCGIGERFEPHDVERMRQLRLVDDANGGPAAVGPNGPVVNAADVHVLPPEKSPLTPTLSSRGEGATAFLLPMREGQDEGVF